MLVLALLLAQSAPPPISTGWQSDLFSFGVIILVALNIWGHFKRKPAIDEVLERKFKEAGDQTDKKVDALDRRREQGEKEIRQLVNDQVSQMEKFISKQITDNRENNTERFGELSGKISALTTSFQGLSNDLMHQVGRLEGRSETAASRRSGAHNIDE